MHLVQEFAFWWVAISVLAVASRRLIRTTGGTIFSVSILMSGPAAMSYWMMQLGSHSAIGFTACILAAGILALLHVPLALWLGAEITLLVSVVLHMMWTEAWLALPEVTGGSGGLFWPRTHYAIAVFSLAVGSLLAGGFEALGSTTKAQYRAALLIHSGKQCAAFGINRNRTMLLAYLTFGSIVGVTAFAVVNWVGFLSLESTGMSFATAILLIALATARRPVFQTLAICGCQALLRTAIRTVFSVSPLISHCLDVALPLFLLFFLLRRQSAESDHSVPTHE